MLVIVSMLTFIPKCLIWFICILLPNNLCLLRVEYYSWPENIHTVPSRYSYCAQQIFISCPADIHISLMTSKCLCPPLSLCCRAVVGEVLYISTMMISTLGGNYIEDNKIVVSFLSIGIEHFYNDDLHIGRKLYWRSWSNF